MDGECLGLQWEDIDFDNGVLYIRHNLMDIGGTKKLSTPKTYFSIRTLKISREIIDMLKNHKEHQDIKKEKLGKLYVYPSMVFTTISGRYMDRSELNLEFRRIIDKDSSIPNITLHDLRHCNATLLINSGVPLKVVSEHLGHSTISTTADIYSHVLESSKSTVSNVISNVLDDAKS